jgi:glc operon protein GlcG
MPVMTRLSLAALFCVLGTSLTFAADLPTKPVLTLKAARTMAEAAEDHARENGWNVCIAILDDGGHLVYFLRMDGTQAGSVLVAQKKAESAVAFKRSTKVFQEAVGGGRTALLALPGAIPLEGGLPITVDGHVIGAIGVSGVTAEQDGLIGQAGLDALEKMLAD